MKNTLLVLIALCSMSTAAHAVPTVQATIAGVVRSGTGHQEFLFTEGNGFAEGPYCATEHTNFAGPIMRTYIYPDKHFMASKITVQKEYGSTEECQKVAAELLATVQMGNTVGLTIDVIDKTFELSIPQ